MPLAHRHICVLCGRAFALVKPPDETRDRHSLVAKRLEFAHRRFPTGHANGRAQSPGRSADARYCFGTGKMGVLGGFASAVILLMVALLMAGDSVYRMFAPLPIRFDAAIGVAVAGLVVNLICALILKDDHHHTHGPGHAHHHLDLNMRAADVHVLADAFTSVTAIVAPLAGKFFGWNSIHEGLSARVEAQREVMFILRG